jgi:hypothetical protein
VTAHVAPAWCTSRSIVDSLCMQNQVTILSEAKRPTGVTAHVAATATHTSIVNADRYRSSMHHQVTRSTTIAFKRSLPA